MEGQIKTILTGLGADLCGIAGIERFETAPSGFHPCDIYKDCKSVIVFAKRIPRGLASVNPRIIYNNMTDKTLFELDRLSYMGSIKVENLGGNAVPIPSDAPYDYWDSESLEGRGVLSMRHAAVLAGIGSMGKNTLVINRQYGNMINIGAILTDLELRSDPLVPEICIPNCRLCLDNCPPQALDGQTVNQKLCRQYTNTSNSRGFSVCNCNRCRMVCPRSSGTAPETG